MAIPEYCIKIRYELQSFSQYWIFKFKYYFTVSKFNFVRSPRHSSWL